MKRMINAIGHHGQDAIVERYRRKRSCPGRCGNPKMPAIGRSTSTNIIVITKIKTALLFY